ncbi:MAG: CHRD domain-containing protein [Cyanosarcina radialis HA8281-LM2]|nr:CHRD domain-containing protein [Cyanosarcina radialis HA8281-LM2]
MTSKLVRSSFLGLGVVSAIALTLPLFWSKSGDAQTRLSQITPPATPGIPGLTPPPIPTPTSTAGPLVDPTPPGIGSPSPEPTSLPTTPSPGLSPFPTPTSLPGTSPLPGSTPFPGTSPLPDSTPFPGTSPSPGTSPFPGTSPLPDPTPTPIPLTTPSPTPTPILPTTPSPTPTSTPGSTVPGSGNSLSAKLTGSESKGSGAAVVTLFKSDEKLCYKVTVSGLDAVTKAGIYKGSAGDSGTEVVAFKSPAAGMENKCVAAKADVLDAITQNPSGYYVSVHTKKYPKGAIRGQLASKP